MTFEDKTEVVISQLRADRDRLQNAFDKIRAEIRSNRDEWIKGNDPEWHTYDRCLYIIDKHKAESVESFSDYPNMPYQFDNMTGSMNL